MNDLLEKVSPRFDLLENEILTKTFHSAGYDSFLTASIFLEILEKSDLKVESYTN